MVENNNGMEKKETESNGEGPEENDRYGWNPDGWCEADFDPNKPPYPIIEFFYPIITFLKGRYPELYRVLKQLQDQRAPELSGDFFLRIYQFVDGKPWLTDEERFIGEFCPRLCELLKQIRDQKEIPMELIIIIFEFLQNPWDPPVLNENGRCDQFDF